MNSGIYKIVNKINGKYYVGKSRNLRDRWNHHKHYLIRNVHTNEHLQRAWNKDGVNNFEFVVVEYLEPNDVLLTEVEQKYLDKFLEDRKNGIHNCYNIAITSDSSVHSEETRKKISESLKGKMVGKKSSFYGKTHSPESRQKISEQLKGKYIGEKNHFYGKTHSKETRERWSEIRKGKNTGKKNPNYGKLSGLTNPRADKTIYNWKNVITNETYTGTRYEFRKAHNVSEDSVRGLIKKKYSRTKTGWTLQENHSDQSFPQPL